MQGQQTSQTHAGHGAADLEYLPTVMSTSGWLTSALVMLAYRLGGWTPAHIAACRLPAHVSLHARQSTGASESIVCCIPDRKLPSHDQHVCCNSIMHTAGSTRSLLGEHSAMLACYKPGLLAPSILQYLRYTSSRLLACLPGGVPLIEAQRGPLDCAADSLAQVHQALQLHAWQAYVRQTGMQHCTVYTFRQVSHLLKPSEGHCAGIPARMPGMCQT